MYYSENPSCSLLDGDLGSNKQTVVLLLLSGESAVGTFTVCNKSNVYYRFFLGGAPFRMNCYAKSTAHFLIEESCTFVLFSSFYKITRCPLLL